MEGSLLRQSQWKNLSHDRDQAYELIVKHVRAKSEAISDHCAFRLLSIVCQTLNNDDWLDINRQLKLQNIEIVPSRLQQYIRWNTPIIRKAVSV